MIVNDNLFGVTKQAVVCPNCSETLLYEIYKVRLIKRHDGTIAPSYRELDYICPNCHTIVYSKTIPLEG